MAFTRKFLGENGVPDDKIDTVMAERNRTLGDYVHKDDVQALIDAALKEHKADPVDPTTTAEYKALMMENTKLKAFATDEFSAVKAPYRDIVWEKLNHEKDHAAYADQLKTVKEAMPDLFSEEQKDAPKNTPQYSQGQHRDNTNPSSADDEEYKKAMAGWAN